MSQTNAQSVWGNNGNAALLITLGLTPREAEVLFWIAQGKANYEIGIILGAGTRTVCKHVEHILDKLHVENRTAAAAVAFAAVSQFVDFF
jgi:DNA-binding CsgD family transcriptional regulator